MIIVIIVIMTALMTMYCAPVRSPQTHDSVLTTVTPGGPYSAPLMEKKFKASRSDFCTRSSHWLIGRKKAELGTGYYKRALPCWGFVQNALGARAARPSPELPWWTLEPDLTGAGNQTRAFLESFGCMVHAQGCERVNIYKSQVSPLILPSHQYNRHWSFLLESK